MEVPACKTQRSKRRKSAKPGVQVRTINLAADPFAQTVRLNAVLFTSLRLLLVLFTSRDGVVDFILWHRFLQA